MAFDEDHFELREVLAEVGRFGHEALLYQDVYWVDAQGNGHRIEDMGSDYLRNVLGFLRRQVARVPFPHFNGEMAQYEAEKEWYRLQEMDFPLVEAINRELSEREVAGGAVTAEERNDK